MKSVINSFDKFGGSSELQKFLPASFVFMAFFGLLEIFGQNLNGVSSHQESLSEKDGLEVKSNSDKSGDLIV